MSKIIICVVLFMSSFRVFAEQDVTFTTIDPDFAIVSTATGKLAKTSTRISVTLDRYTLRANPIYKTPQKLLRYKIGLAFNRANGKWDIARWSAPFELNAILSPGETRLIKNVKAAIQIDNLPSLKNYWLVIAVELESKGKVGYTYAHSDEGLF